MLQLLLLRLLWASSLQTSSLQHWCSLQLRQATCQHPAQLSRVAWMSMAAHHLQ